MIAELDDIEVRRDRRTVLHGLSLAIEAGTLTVVAGADGSGRSTLLQALAGMRTPHSGRTRLPDAMDIGYVSQGPGIYLDLTVLENLRFAAAAYRLRGPVRTARIEGALEVTALGAARERLAGRLSGGMRQKLAFACAVLHEPTLLVLDEPTTGVDPISRAELWRLASTQLARGAAAVVATSYLDEAARADQVVLLEDGRAVATGAPDEVLARAAPAARVVAGRHRRSDGETLVDVRDLTVGFGPVQAVDGVSLRISAGEVVGLLGANGAGKTTTIRAVLGLQRPTAGSVSLLGAPPTRGSRAQVGYVPQSLGLWQDLTPRENLAFIAAAYGTPSPPVPTALDGARGRPVASLPLGHRRRLAFEAALGHRPRLLILDEPTSGVGAADRAELWDRIGSASRAGAGVLVTTHHLSEAEHCDRIVVLLEGRVAITGTLAALLADRTTVVVRSDDWAEAFRRLDACFPAVALAGREVRVPDADQASVATTLAMPDAEVVTAPASLDEVFVTLGRAS